MALQQEVVKATIIQFNEEYVNRFEHRLSDKSLSCKSCGIEFEHEDFIHSDINTRGPWVKRHLVCAIAHHVIELAEAKELAARKELTINWREIDLDIKQYLDNRRKMFMQRLACLALAISMFGVNAINTIL